jgi:hypothetical protein
VNEAYKLQAESSFMTYNERDDPSSLDWQERRMLKYQKSSYVLARHAVCGLNMQARSSCAFPQTLQNPSYFAYYLKANLRGIRNT